MIAVRVRLFAVLRERAGASEITLNLPEGATVADAVRAVGRDHSALASFLPRVAYALNESYVKTDASLRDGDELALIPPVSGGSGDARV
jgi:molybdopterin synthase catalytic subunit